MARYAPPPLPASAPRFGNAVTRAIGRVVLRAIGWRVEGSVPDISRCVAILAPHTSNFDLPVCCTLMFALDVRVNWLGKHTIFRGPFRPFFTWLGGVPVDRGAATGLVEQAAARLQAADRLFLGIAPEGTRKRVGKWKTGFYRIACQAALPIVTVALDYPNRRAIIWPPFTPTGDLEADMAVLQARYDRRMARHPERYEEDASIDQGR